MSGQATDEARKHASGRRAPAEVGRWIVLAVVLLTPVFLASLTRIVDHKFGLHWDEAMHINQAYEDTAQLQAGVVPYVRFLFGTARDRLPAYRLLHQPVTLAVGVSPLSLRLVALAALFGTLALVFACVQLAAGRAAAVFSVLFAALSPSILFPSSQFGTEYALFLATGGAFWAIARLIYRGATSRFDTLMLGAFLGLGALSKTNFIVLITPCLLLLWLAARFHVLTAPRPAQLYTAAGIGLGIGLPWWVVNWRPSLGGAYHASTFTRHAWPPMSWAYKMLVYNGFVAECGFGYPLAALAVLVAAWGLVAWRRTAVLMTNRRHLVMMGLCLSAACTLFAVQFLGQNQNARHFAPAILTIAVALGLVAGKSHLIATRRFFVVAALLCGSQVLLMITQWPYDRVLGPAMGFIGEQPSTVFHTYDQWDWEPLRARCVARWHTPSGITIGHLGSGFSFNPPQIAFPWERRNELVTVETLWRYEEGSLDWNTLSKRLDGVDVVVTAPKFVGFKPDKQDLDNQYNASLVERLEADDQFGKPEVLYMGAHGEEVDVFFRKAVRAHPPLSPQ